MRWPTLAPAAALCATLLACDSLPFIGGGEEEAAQPDTLQATPTPAVPDTATPAPPEPAPPPSRPARARRPLADEPWQPVDTGTVYPGMSRQEVIAVWGVPVTERLVANRMYLYFRNGCEVTCGTYDVVFFEDGQVVDAVVRGVGHTYGGTSSSPPERQAQPTLPQRGPASSGAA